MRDKLGIGASIDRQKTCNQRDAAIAAAAIHKPGMTKEELVGWLVYCGVKPKVAEEAAAAEIAARTGK